MAGTATAMAQETLQGVPTGLRGAIQARLAGYGGALVLDSLVYLAGAALIGIGNFILLPLYTRCLSASEFGTYALLDVSILLVVTVAQLGLGISYLKWYADLDPSRHSELLGSSVAAALVSGTVGGVALMLLAGLAGWPVAAGHAVPWLLLAVVPIEGVQGILLSDLRARRRSILFCAAAAGRLLVMGGATLWFVQVQKQAVAGVLLGRVIGGGVGVALLGAISLPLASPRVSLDLLRGMLRYGTPLVWSALVGVGMDASGRYLLARHTGLDQVAIYTVALKISAVMQVGFLQPFGTAWTGMMFQIGRDQNAPLFITSILSGAFITAMTLAAGISILAPLALPLFGPIYHQAASLIPWLLLPSAFRILEYWSSLGLFLTHRTGRIAGAATGGALANIAAISVLVPRLGAFGAALSWVLALSLTVVAYVLLGRRYYRLPANWAALALGLAIWAAGWIAARLIPPGCTPRSIQPAALALFLVSAPAMVYAARKLRGVREGVA